MSIGTKRPKMVNRPDPIRSFAHKVGTAAQVGAQLFGAVKSAWDIGRSVVQAGRIVAPYIATAASAVM